MSENRLRLLRNYAVSAQFWHMPITPNLLSLHTDASNVGLGAVLHQKASRRQGEGDSICPAGL